jgi:hypothetical protein
MTGGAAAGDIERILGASGRRPTFPRGAVPTSTAGHFRHGTESVGTPKEPRRVEIPLAVDGAKNPELIPDDVAYRHFISVTAATAAASEEEIRRRDAFVAQLELLPADRTSYLAALSNVREALIDTEQRLRVSHSNSETVAELRRQRGRILDDAAARVLTSLSPDGVQRVEAHINGHVKKHIRIYGQAQ